MVIKIHAEFDEQKTFSLQEMTSMLDKDKLQKGLVRAYTHM